MRREEEERKKNTLGTTTRLIHLASALLIRNGFSYVADWQSNTVLALIRNGVPHCGRCLLQPDSVRPASPGGGAVIYIYARTHPTPSLVLPSHHLFLLRPRRLLSKSKRLVFLDQERSPMASVERAMAKAAASLLPGLLPTPQMKPCLIILPASFASKPKPGRADCVDRWDAHKKDKKPKSPASSCSSSSSPGRASSGERWDINMQNSSSSGTSSSSLSSRRSSTSPGMATSCGRWDSNKRLLPSRASSADRWDMYKKPRREQASAESWTSDKEEQEDETTAMVPNPIAPPPIGPMFSGPTSFALPDPSMLPVPTFFRSRNPGVVLPVQAFLGVH